MTKDQLTKLRGYYQSLRGQLRVLEQKPSEFNARVATVNVLTRTFSAIEADFPGAVPAFVPQEAHSHDEIYHSPTLRAQVAAAIGILEAQLAEDEEGPVVTPRTFGFMHDSALRTVVERDYVEIQRAFVAQCWKSVIILAGGALEAVLTDLLLHNEPAAKAAASAPSQKDIGRWDLVDLINVAVEMRLVTAGVSKLSHPVREFRNLVHASNEIRNSLTFGREEAGIAIEVIHILHRDLSP